MNLRETILGVSTLRRVPVELPEWPGTGGKLFMRELSEADFLGVQQDLMDRHPHRRARLATKILVDADGNAVLSEADAISLAGQAAGPLARLWGDWHAWIETLRAEQKKTSKTTSKKQSGKSR